MNWINDDEEAYIFSLGVKKIQIRVDSNVPSKGSESLVK